MKLLLAVALFFLAPGLIPVQSACNEKVLMCYYTSWSYYRESQAHYNISLIDPFLCTHYIYSFAGLDLNGQITALDYGYDVTKGGYVYFNSLKQINPNLKTSLAIGGWNEGSMKYSVMVSSAKTREAFADSVLFYLATYNFDGLDIDWEYPTQRGGIPDDKDNFGELLKVLYEKFAPWGFTIGVAVPTDLELTSLAYNMSAINKYVDHVKIMAYDYTPTTSKVTGLNANFTNIKEVIEMWQKGGVDPCKIVMGAAAYARSFTLANNATNGIGAAVTGPGKPGVYTKEGGSLAYYELQGQLKGGGYKPTTMNAELNLYASKTDQWLSYDDNSTYQSKTNYANCNNLGGMMVWAIDYDDFLGVYGVNYTVTRTIKNQLFNVTCVQ